MKSDAHERIEAIFIGAIEREGDVRATFLDDACGDDLVLRGHVLELIEAHHEAGSLLDPIGPEPADRMRGRRVGGFTIERLLGSGGMGAVYLARQDNPRRPVALKVMRWGLASRSATRRFDVESRILGRLQHPNIARVYDAGTHDDGSGGVPYFAMEYVADARSITAYAKSEGLGPRERLALFTKVCDAVHHGHQKGVIHRDLKPSNVLVDPSGEPRIIDFGVAKTTDADLSVTTLRGDLGQLIGTLQYMSPEQCGGNADDLDTRSDVYALGVLLYELLCDRLPYEVGGLPFPEAARVIREEDPTRPSSLNRILRREVETIALKALEKDRDRRYQSAADLGQDIERYLRGEAIEAHPPSAAYRVRTFARRHKVAFAVMTLLAVAVPLLAAVTTVAVRAAARERAAHDQLAKEKATAEFRAYVASVTAAEGALARRQYRRVQGHLAKAPACHRGWEWGYLQQQSDRSRAVVGHEAMVDGVALSPDGSVIASGTRDGTIRLWDADTATLIGTLEGRHDGYVLALAFSPDGTLLASGSTDRTIRVWDVGSRRLLRAFEGHGSDVKVVVFRRDGSKLISASDDRTVRGWEVASGAELWTARHEAGVQCVAIGPGETRLVTGDARGAVAVWDLETVTRLGSFDAHDDIIRRVAIGPDGERLVSSSRDHVVRCWSMRTNELLWETEAGEWGAVFSPDGSRVAVGDVSPSFVIRLLDAASGRSLATLPGHADTAYTLAFSARGDRLISGSWDRTVRVWDVGPSGLPTILDTSDVVNDVAYSPDGHVLATLGNDGSVGVRDAATLAWLYRVFEGKRVVRATAIDLAGSRLAVGWSSGRIDLFDAGSGRRLSKLKGHRRAVTSLAFGPGGALVSGSSDRTAIVWDPALGTRRHTLRGHDRGVSAVAFSARGRVATVSDTVAGTIRLWDAPSGALIATMPEHASTVSAVAFSPDGRWLVSGSRDKTVHLRDGRSGALERVLDDHGQWITDLAFTPDGARLAGTSFFRTLTVWDATSFEMLLNVPAHEDVVHCVAFHPDGQRLVTGSSDRTIRVWDARSRETRHRDRAATLARLSDAQALVERTLAEHGDVASAAGAIERDPPPDALTRWQAWNTLLSRGAAGRSTPALEERIDAAVVSFMQEWGVPGATVAVSKHGRLVHSKGYGFADIERGIRMQPWHRTRIGGTGDAVLLAPALLTVLESAPGVDLDTPLYGTGGVFEHEPFLDDIEVGLRDLSPKKRDRQREWYRALTVRHSLTFSTGFVWWPPGSVDPAEPGASFRDVHRQILRTKRLRSAAGAGVRGQSFHGRALSAYIVSVLTGTPYKTYVDDLLLRPLGLTGVVAPEGLVVDERDARPHERHPDRPDRRPTALEVVSTSSPGVHSAAGGWVGTARDLVRLMVAMDGLDDPPDLVSETTRRAMQTVVYADHLNRTCGWRTRANAAGHQKCFRIGRPRGGHALVVMYPEGYVSADGTELGGITMAICLNTRGDSDALEGSVADPIALMVGEASIPPTVDLWKDE